MAISRPSGKQLNVGKFLAALTEEIDVSGERIPVTRPLPAVSITPVDCEPSDFGKRHDTFGNVSREITRNLSGILMPNELHLKPSLIQFLEKDFTTFELDTAWRCDA